MNAYGALAASYDRLTNDVDYEGWVDFAHAILDSGGGPCVQKKRGALKTPLFLPVSGSAGVVFDNTHDLD